MKHTRMILTALMAAALALAVLAGCSSVLAGTVHEDTEQAAALMKEIDTGLAYSTELEAAASRLAEWLVEEPGQLGTQSGQLARKVELTADSGNMTDKNLNEFIDHSSISSNIWVNIPNNVTIGLVLDNQSRAFTGYLYAPAAGQAARSLSRCAAGCSFQRTGSAKNPAPFKEAGSFSGFTVTRQAWSARSRSQGRARESFPASARSGYALPYRRPRRRSFRPRPAA